MTVDAVLIAGPTASGKSALALALAEKLGGVVINADSMQVYAEAPVLTAAPDAAARARVPHFLYGHVSARDGYSTGRYAIDAARALQEARAMKRIPVFTGGTGLYFTALTEGLSDMPAIPAAVRALRWHLLVCALLFVVPTLAMGLATWHDPRFVLTVVPASSVRNFDAMYGPAAGEHLGRTSGDDWQMFGFYVMHNIGIAFQCFAAGLFAGVGSLLMVAYNGLLGGAVGGFLVTRGDSERFFSFVVTHSAFELTAIVLSGACGMKLGQAMLAPGRRTRTGALVQAARDCVPVMYGAFGMLTIAAALEAFWSSAGWIAPAVKYGVGAACWLFVLTYLGVQGRVPEGRR